MTTTAEPPVNQGPPGSGPAGQPQAAVTAVRIQRLRGIYEGELLELTPLTVIVGPNGSGKSTILEALHLGAAPEAQNPISSVLQQRPFIQDQYRWLRWRGLPDVPPDVGVTTAAGRVFNWQFVPQGPQGILVRSAVGTGAPGDVEGIGRVFFLHPPAPNITPPLAREYSEAIILGGAPRMVAMVQRVLGASDLRILVEKDQPALFVSYSDYAVPVAGAGAGAEWLIHLGLGLLAPAGSLALVEEPEIHLHPGGMREAARAILAAVSNGVQVVMSTHSLELVDALLTETSTDAELGNISVIRVRLDNGHLKKSRIVGADVAFLRVDIAEDLR